MKRRDLLKCLRVIARAAGMELIFVREGINHELWEMADVRLLIPRHREINEYTARAIIKRAEEVTGDGDK